MNKADLGKLVQERRLTLSLKQQDLAEMAATTTKTIYMIESGRGNPSIDTLIKLLNVLGLELNVTIRKTAQ